MPDFAQFDDVQDSRAAEAFAMASTSSSGELVRSY